MWNSAHRFLLVISLPNAKAFGIFFSAFPVFDKINPIFAGFPKNLKAKESQLLWKYYYG